MLIIAEIGQNHNGDMEMARKLITAVKEAGADIVKFQLFDVDAIFPRLIRENEDWQSGPGERHTDCR